MREPCPDCPCTGIPPDFEVMIQWQPNSQFTSLLPKGFNKKLAPGLQYSAQNANGANPLTVYPQIEL
jgi:hypothetical protein